MKKHLLAIAVASAVAVPAMAQVSISGRIDTSIQRAEDSAGKSTTRIDSNLLTTNEIVIAGTEDLGGGLKAGFGPTVKGHMHRCGLQNAGFCPLHAVFTVHCRLRSLPSVDKPAAFCYARQACTYSATQT